MEKNPTLEPFRKGEANAGREHLWGKIRAAFGDKKR